MKLIIRDYLASLKEREELDAILPDLLSEIGFTVYSRPGRGTTQYGVDVAAVGEDEDGERKVFLFSVKQGDLTRRDWNVTEQSLRQSFDDIQDVYIPTRIPKRYENLKIVICACFGGDVQEQVRPMLTGYINAHTTDRVSFAEWNGDKLAGLVLQGILREEILPKPLRSRFQKAVAMVDEPDVSFAHFVGLVTQLRESTGGIQKLKVRVARQIYICLWILFVWARDAGNLESPYRASEIALLNVWELARGFVGKNNKNSRAITSVFHALIRVHIMIVENLLVRKILPHVGKRHALSMGVESRSSVDVNLKLFDVLGRIAMLGLWLNWFGQKLENEEEAERHGKVREIAEGGFKLIHNNPTLLLPRCDHQAIDIALFLCFASSIEGCEADISGWLQELTTRLALAIRTHGKYPCVFGDYRDLVDHPRERSDEYRSEATSGSTLIPLVAAWLSALGDSNSLETISELTRTELSHCTLQLWLVDEVTEEKLYVGEHGHGVALCDLAISNSGKELLDTVSEACRAKESFSMLSPVRTGYWPIVLLACRHYRHPIPPQFWINVLRPLADDGEGLGSEIAPKS